MPSFGLPLNAGFCGPHRSRGYHKLSHHDTVRSRERATCSSGDRRSSHKISFRCWNWASGLLWENMNISLLEAKDCVISASNSCFLCDLGGCRSTEPPFRESGKLPRDCTQGYPLLCGPEPGQGVGRGCGSVLASLIYSST